MRIGKFSLSLSPTTTSDENNASEGDCRDGIIFEKFKISELFTGRNGDTDIKKEHINGKGYQVVSSGVDNLGIIGKTDLRASILPRNTITVDMFGNVFFRDFEYKIVTHARVFTLIPKGFSLGVETGLYITSLLHYLSKIFSYSNMCSYKKIKDELILLPVIKSSTPNHKYTINDICFDYMERYTRALEKLAIADVIEYKDDVIKATKQVAGISQP